VVKKRRSTENGWRDDPNFGQRQFWLKNGSIFMLHPDDERPKKRAGQKYISQFQHGVDVRNGISVALVFRVVTSKAKVCVVDNIIELLDKDEERLAKIVRFHTGEEKTVAEHHDDARERFFKKQAKLESHFRSFVIKTMKEFKW
jgi:hypothetical protein